MPGNGNARNRAVLQLRELIVRGEILPGQHLTENETADLLGVGRGAVREAFSALIELGLLESIPNRGVFVGRIDMAQHSEITVARIAIEGLAASLAAARGDARLEQELRDLNNKMAVKTSDLFAFSEANHEFHRAVFEMGGNRVLLQFAESLWARCYGFRLSAWFSREAMERSYEEHALIIDAIAARDVDRAFHAGVNHVGRLRGVDAIVLPKALTSVPHALVTQDGTAGVGR